MPVDEAITRITEAVTTTRPEQSLRDLDTDAVRGRGSAPHRNGRTRNIMGTKRNGEGGSEIEQHRTIG